MAIKIPLLDPLGLPVSPEFSWEAAGSGARTILGAVGDTFKEIAGITEGPVSAKDLANTRVEVEVASNRVEGSMSGFQKPRKKEDVYGQRLKTEQEILAVRRENQVVQSLAEKRAEINSQIGIGNVLYEDTVSNSGEVRIDVQTDVARKNTELSAEQIKSNRRNVIAQATGEVNRIAGADMNRNFEDHNMQSPG